ncbi:di-trans,poly-cis-decaprenylcistransferase [Streptomyces sp. WAC 06783]|nr:di-trans,poly-cis-decaprenylcistransferase [Streptomyces sp. WAC 06783]
MTMNAPSTNTATAHGVHAAAPGRTPPTAAPEGRPGRPRHIAVILDGNRRWARHHQAPLEQAYAQGARRVVDLATWCEEAQIPVVTVWALSQDNLQRAPAAIAQVLDAVACGLHRIAASGRWRIRPIGDLDLLPPAQADQLLTLARTGAGGTWGTLNVAVGYAGRADIVTAVRALLHSGDGHPAHNVGETDLAQHLSTAGQPDIDLVIRTSGEQRLSGFMPWQAAYAEFYFTPVLWPDFSADDFATALDFYQTRQRRYGK